jgi:hypothetical protein
MSIKPPARCMLCGDPMPTCCGITITLSSDTGSRRLSWHEDCAARDELHEDLADADAMYERADTDEVREAALDAMALASRRIVASLESRHHKPARLLAVWRSVLGR